MRLQQVSESGYYYALFRRNLMNRALKGNSFWTPIRIEIVEEDSIQMGKKILKRGTWICEIGSSNWYGLEAFLHIGIVDVQKMVFPEIVEDI